MMSAVPGEADREATWEALSSAGHAIEFLAAEGFLVHQGALLDGSQFMQVRLTMKGLAVLGSVPGSLEKRESLISKILSVIGKGLKEAASEQVSELSGQAFAFALASAPNFGGSYPSLTIPLSGLSKAGCACLRLPLMSNVRPLKP